MATPTATIVGGFFSSRSKVIDTVEDLANAGFRSEQMGLATHSDAPSGRELTEKGTAKAGDVPLREKIAHFFERRMDYDYNPEQVRGSLETAGITPEKARYFEYMLARNDTAALLTVNAPGREREAEQIMERHGADIGRNAAGFAYPAAAAAASAGAMSGSASRAASTAAGTGRRKIQLLGEVLRIHKERVPLGEAQIRKEVVTERQNIEVPTSREELVVERKPVTGSTPAGNIGADSEIRVPLSEERVTVQKEPKVREEVEVGKREVESTQSVAEQLRHEELRVEKNEKAKEGTPEPPPKVRKQTP